MAVNHNSLSSQFQIASAFWEPNAENVIYTGTLTANKSGIRFTTSPEYQRRLRVRPTRGIERMLAAGSRFDTMHGFTEEGRCTLLQIIEIDRPGFTDIPLDESIEATTFHVSACVFGVHIGGFGDQCVTSARYTFSGLGDWLPKVTNEIWQADRIMIEVPLEARELLAFSLLGNHAEVSVKIFSELTSDDNDGARRSRSVPYIEIRSALPESLTWFLEVGDRLENLFSLLTGGSLALETLFIQVGEDSGHAIVRRKHHFRRFNILDSVRCGSPQLANAMAIWLSQPPGFRSVEDVALGVVRKGDLFNETEFLSLSQALEGLHRFTAPRTVADKAEFRKVRKKIVAMLEDDKVNAGLSERICSALSHVNETTFASRLSDLCERLSEAVLVGMKIDKPKFVSDIVATRNFYTHTGKVDSRKRPALSGGRLFLLNQKMRALLRGNLLLHLQIPEDRISDLLVREATIWR